MSQTLLVTGANGYIAQHVVLQALQAGHVVVGSLRDATRGEALREVLAPHLGATPGADRLRFVSLNLLEDHGWEAAMDRVDAVLHTASPVPMMQPEDPEEVIRPAVDGAMRAVRAAKVAGITRLVLTSSIAAIMNDRLRPGQTAYDESNWTDPSDPAVIPYSRSKTLAERAVWDWQKAEGPEMQITAINPAFVMGPPLDDRMSSSLLIVKRLLKGKDPVLARIGFTMVDVRDIAQMHLRALERPESIGHRFVGADRFFWFSDLAKRLKARFPDRKIATRTAPDLMIKLMARFDPALRPATGMLGKSDPISSKAAQSVLGIDFHDAGAAFEAAAQHMVDHKLV